jgi:chromosome segregation protein
MSVIFMLKQLELVGFKSFAERTVFEFGPGVTAVVGPNGSGKSNVVDAVRWIMGEQSAKSLRGGGMTDVIFNGSATRKSLGLAEVSLTLQNDKRFLNVDADEVQITRRVYRDGTGEYLINKQPARLRDIKEMFLGSGAGVDAYCIIAQGRVEALLQASSQERRFILEEAAGISRFRLKKLETLRKLEQVEQNLQRVRDIQEELHRQLQSVRLQAAKAERYREYTEELKRLRVALALQEWHQDTLKLQAASAELATHKQTLQDRSAEAAAQKLRLIELEAQLAQEEGQARHYEATLSSLREQAAVNEGAIKHETATLADLEGTLKALGERRELLTTQERRLIAILDSLQLQVNELEAARATASQRLVEVEQAQKTTVRRLAELREKMQRGKETLYERLQASARAHNDLVSLRAQADSLRQHRRRLGEKHAQTQGTLTAIDLELKSLEAREQDTTDRMAALREALVEVRERKEQAGIQLEELTGRWTADRERHSGLSSRIQVLDALEKSREGVGAGVRKILELSSQEIETWRGVVGMIADLILVDREYAGLVDTVLGDQAQALFVTDWETVQAGLHSLGEDLPGRVSVLPASSLAGEKTALLPGLEPLARYVGTLQPEWSALAEHLLANTWIVEHLDQARQWALHYPGHRFITRRGELLDEQGLISLGPDRDEHGFLSRKSELRELRHQTRELEIQIAQHEQEIHDVRSAVARLSAQEEQTEQGLQVLVEESAGLRSQLQQKRLQGQDLAEEVRVRQHELSTLEEELARLVQDESVTQQKANASEQAAQCLQQELQQAETESANLEALQSQEQEAVLTAKVAHTKAEAEVGVLADRLEAARLDRAEKQAETESLRRQDEEALSRQASSRAAIAQAQAILEAGIADRARTEAEHQETLQRMQQLRQEAQSLRETTQSLTQEWQQLVDRVHARELEVSELRLRMDGLSVRLQEEHEVQLIELYVAYSPPDEPLDAAATQDRVNDLRRKIARLGNVSLDSLQELAALETRAAELQKQRDDLAQAKAALDEIIERINADSKKLFKQTYESIRGHFQELFRKLFGGGMADIVLENPDDLLETGVDIVARPPGKEMRNMSLLSGGEKTLTAVALLLAIFKNRPSPFCIMDEVDAALDEANVARFAAVLREFLHLSQFILITHSKKTMAAADVLYGVTMQEAGVSKRVAIRLEDYEEPAQRLAA